MSKKQIKVTFKTLTPLWTGDAWGDNKEIRPSSLMGSLRFWFEVICYFARITNNSNYKDGKLKDEFNEKEFKKIIVSNGNDFEGIDKTLAEMNISLPSRIFGCTGWKGWVRIKEINFDEDNFNNSLSGRIIDGKNWFWGKPSYQGDFSVVFKIEENIIEPIFYPLLTFMEKYGFWGGKWNIGYGRLKVEGIEEKNKFVFSNFNGDFEDKKFSDIIEISNNFSQLEQITQNHNKIMYFSDSFSDTYVKEIIKNLIIKKAQERKFHKNNINDVNLRHGLFGTILGGTQGTKIIPWIYEENGQLKGGFISIAGILNLRD